MPKAKFLNLANAFNRIQEYRSSATHLSEEDKRQLSHLQSRLRAIESIQNGWLRNAGHLSTFWQTQQFQTRSVNAEASELEDKQSHAKSGDVHQTTHAENTKMGKGEIDQPLPSSNKKESPTVPKVKMFTQDDLIKEARDTYFKSLNFTHIAMQDVKRDITQPHGLYSQTVKKHPKLFQEIEECIDGVLDFIAKDRTLNLSKNTPTKDIATSYPELTLTETEERDFEKPTHQFARHLGGSFVPSNQFSDPLMGAKKVDESVSKGGGCFGYLFNWSKEVESTGRFLSLQRYNSRVSYYQENQADLPRGSDFVSRNFKNNLWQIVDDLIMQLDDRFIYNFSFSNRSGPGHTMGMRKIPNSTQIEFYDANFLLFVFPNIESFKTWLIELMNKYLHDENEIRTLELSKIGIQPKNATASIPPLASGTPPLDLQYPKRINKTYPLLLMHSKLQVASSRIQQGDTGETRDDIERKVKQGIVAMERTFKENIKPQHKGLHNPFANLKSESITDYHNQFKEKAIASINNEIDRLQKNWIGDSADKIAALNTLKQKINAASLGETLSTIVDHWLGEKPAGRVETHRQIIENLRITIKTEHSKCFQFVCTLVQNHEINPACIGILQHKLLYKIHEIISRSMSAQMSSAGTEAGFLYPNNLNMHSQKLNSLSNLLDNYSTSDHGSNQLLNLIIETCNNKSLSIKNPSKINLAKFFEILEKLDPLDKKSLEETDAALEMFIRKHLPQHAAENTVQTQHRV